MNRQPAVYANVLFFDKKPPSEEASTKELWVYDLRTNKRFTLKERPMVKADLDDFTACYRSGRRFEREEPERFRRYPLETLLARDKVNLDVFWLKDDTLDDPDLLPPPDEVAAEVVESLEAALERFRGVAASLGGCEAGGHHITSQTRLVPPSRRESLARAERPGMPAIYSTRR